MFVEENACCRRIRLAGECFGDDICARCAERRSYLRYTTVTRSMKLPVAAYSAEADASAAKAGSYGVFGERE